MGLKINAEQTVFVKLHMVSGVTISILLGENFTLIISELKGTLGSICWVELVASSSVS